MRLPSATSIALEPSSATPRARIEKAARELETQFAQMLIKSMRATSMGDSMMGKDNTYRDMYDQQLSRELTKGRGLGLAPMIMRQLERSTSVPAPSGGAAAPVSYPLLTPGAPMPLSTPASAPMPTALSGALPLAAASAGVSMPAFDLPTLMITASAADIAQEIACPPEAPLDCSSPEAFVKSIWPHAQKTAAELGVSAKALVAQAALETGWGRRLVGREGVTSHNLFGIKAGGKWGGERMSAATHEFVNGVRQNQRAEFRAYSSTSDSFADYARLIGGTRYAAARGAGDDTQRFASALQKAGYATDPSYAAKISAIANGPTLNRVLAALPRATTANVAVASPVIANPAAASPAVASPAVASNFTAAVGPRG
ncbi:MAG: flagellar assembly peptidoglycan hydrolase FlgJ [Lysobacter sp.]